MRKDERCHARRIVLAERHEDGFMNPGRLLWRKKLIEQLTLIFETIERKILDRCHAVELPSWAAPACADMLHSAILPHHTKWFQLFEQLRFIVVDEAHSYRGVEPADSSPASPR